MKLLFILLAVFVAYWILKHRGRENARRRGTQPSHGSEDMVRCEHCGLHLPRSEGIASENSFYCSVEHRRLHQPVR